MDQIREGLFTLLEELESQEGETSARAGRTAQPVRVPSLYSTRLDSSGRLRLPAAVARGLEEIRSTGLVLIAFPTGLPVIFDAATFSAFDCRVLDRDNWCGEESDWLLREIYASFYPVEPDRRNRLLIPRWSRSHHGLADVTGRVRPTLALMVYGRRVITVSAAAAPESGLAGST